MLNDKDKQKIAQIIYCFMNRDFRIIKYFQSKVCHNTKFSLGCFSGEVCGLWSDCQCVKIYSNLYWFILTNPKETSIKFVHLWGDEDSAICRFNLQFGDFWGLLLPRWERWQKSWKITLQIPWTSPAIGDQKITFTSLSFQNVRWKRKTN